MEDDLRYILRNNVLKYLSQHEPLKGHESGVSRMVKLGIALGTAQRLLNGQTSIGLDVLAQVSAALGVEPWRLLKGPENSGATRSGFNAARTIARLEALPLPVRQAFDELLATLAEEH